MTEIIRRLKNRKIWAFITEAEWEVNNSVKKSYVRRISNCKSQLVKNTDRFIILYNKVDKKMSYSMMDKFTFHRQRD